MSYRRLIRIEFNHCDPAGIVFYPRYFEMTNSVTENFFREEVGWSYARMMAAGIGVPTARLETDFLAPSCLGDELDWELVVERLGRTSVTFRQTATCGGATRLKARLTQVWVAPDLRPAPWPEEVKARLAAHLEAP